CRDVPDLKVPVVARGDQPRAVRAEGQGPYLAGLGEGRAGLPGSRVPQAHRAVPAPRGDPLAVGAIGQWVDVTLVAAEQRRAQPGPHFPDPRGPVRGSRRQAPAVPAKFELDYLLGVAVEHREVQLVLGSPEPHSPVVTAGGDTAPVRAVHGGLNLVAMPPVGDGDELAGGDGPLTD